MNSEQFVWWLRGYLKAKPFELNLELCEIHDELEKVQCNKAQSMPTSVVYPSPHTITSPQWTYCQSTNETKL